MSKLTTINVSLALIFIFLMACVQLMCNDEKVDLRDQAEFISTCDYQIYLLERLGQGECSICDEEEIKMVMSVAMNRVDCNRFPDNLHDVLYQDNQFHGMYRVDLDKYGREIISPKVTRCAKDIVDEGSILDPNILGFLYPSGIKGLVGKRWYKKVRDSVKHEMNYHHFYSGKPCK